MSAPLFQTNFFPDFTHVYLMFEIVFVEFNFVHKVPAIEAEFAGKSENTNVALIKDATRDNLVRSMWARLATNLMNVSG